MGVPSLVDRLATYAIIVLFLAGVWEANSLVQSDIPWYKDVFSQTIAGDYSKLIDATKIAIGWSVITPTMQVSNLPFYLQWYGWYYSLIIPSGFIPIPGAEIFIFISLTMLIVVLPLAIVTKRWRKARGEDGLPWWFYVSIPVSMLLLYPFFVWFGLQLFSYGMQSFFGMSAVDAEAMWISFGERTSSFSLFFVVVSLLGLYKGVKWSGKSKVF